MRSSNACRVSRPARRLGSRIGRGALAALAAIAGLIAVTALVAGGPQTAYAGSEKASAPPTLAALLAGFRTLPGFEAQFEETKTLALLAAPLRSRGRLYFAPPATLLRRVEAPNPHDILIRDDIVRIATPGSPGSARDVQTIDLARRADVRPLVESMLWIFSGDLAQLEAIYRIDYRVLTPASGGRWQLGLTPRAAPLSNLVRSLSISGRGHAAESLEVVEAAGDRTTTRFFDANPERRFAAGEIEALFGIPAP